MSVNDWHTERIPYQCRLASPDGTPTVGNMLKQENIMTWGSCHSFQDIIRFLTHRQAYFPHNSNYNIHKQCTSSRVVGMFGQQQQSHFCGEVLGARDTALWSLILSQKTRYDRGSKLWGGGVISTLLKEIYSRCMTDRELRTIASWESIALSWTWLFKLNVHIILLIISNVSAMLQIL